MTTNSAALQHGAAGDQTQELEKPNSFFLDAMWLVSTPAHPALVNRPRELTNTLGATTSYVPRKAGISVSLLLGINPGLGIGGFCD